MRHSSIIALTAGIAVAAAACDGENRFRTGEAITDPITVPVYDAVAMEFDDGVGDVIDLMDRGAAFDIELDENDLLFESNLRFGSTLTISGTYEVNGNVLTLSDDPFLDDNSTTTRTMTRRTAGNTLILETGTVALDVDNDGSPELGELTIYLDPRG